MTFQTSDHSAEKQVNSNYYENNYDSSAEQVTNDEENINGDGEYNEEDDSSENKDNPQNNNQNSHQDNDHSKKLQSNGLLNYINNKGPNNTVLIITKFANWQKNIA